MSDDPFGGAWLVTEYVFNPDGSFAGNLHQRRTLAATEGGTGIRVTQVCEPDTALDGHAMAGFAGEWVFDMEVHGDHRHYLGPDVVGRGTLWAEGAMTGSGVWPRFGYEFRSYSVLVNPRRQLTGGTFSLAGRSVADIVGVAVPEMAGVDPRLDLTVEPPTFDEPMMVERRIGPMRVGLSRVDPATTIRRAAMSDPISGTITDIAETLSDDNTSATIRIVG